MVSSKDRNGRAQTTHIVRVCAGHLVVPVLGGVVTLSLFDGEGKIGLRSVILATLSALLLLADGRVLARPTTPYEAEQAVVGWLATDARPLGTTMGRHVIMIETFTNDSGEPIYHIVHLYPAGFVIVAADDLVEPIIGFADHGFYSNSAKSPLAALVTSDLNERVVAARVRGRDQATVPTAAEPRGKWHRFVSLALATANGFTAAEVQPVNDVRVVPLLQSKWGQGDVCGKNCFNYYTPSHYYCGCVATAMAQLMRYHQHPLTAIGVRNFTMRVEGQSQIASTRGGDGTGGPYDWRNMVLAPDCQTTEMQRQAIAALCYDASLTVDVDYGPDGSSGDMLKAKEALLTVFKYANAVNGYNNHSNIGSGLTGMINPNLDYGSPVILGLFHIGQGHAVVCDGYGYSASTVYHHLNMGWGGADDAWYNLPNVEAHYTYTSVIVCVYNIFASGGGELISGRVTNASGAPISGVTVTAKGSGGPYAATTNAKGIYALAHVPAVSTYTLIAAKQGYQFADQTVRTGSSRDGQSRSGNRWPIDFVGNLAGDCDGDDDVDAADFAVFASAWLTEPGDIGWNPRCDIASPADHFVDALDLAVFVDNWLAGVK